MEPRLRPVETVTPCKCCGTAAALYGVVDFTKSCEEGRGKILPLSGVPVYYHRCPACGFIFTIAFDDFSPEDFARHVYNDEYILVDPDYTRVRPEANARSIAGAFKGARSLRILDYGGGTGVLAEGLRAAGFQDVQTYDPFVPRFADRAEGPFDMVVSFEVVEHSTDPRNTFDELTSLTGDDGLLLFSTLVQPPVVEKIRVAWWYVAPRNGHVSIYTRKAIASLLPKGMKLASLNDNIHIAFRTLPAFASHLRKA